MVIFTYATYYNWWRLYVVIFNETLDKTSHFDLVCAIWTWLEHERHSDLLVFFRGLCELAGYTS